MTCKYKEETITRVVEKLVSITCDWCGVSMESPRGYNERNFRLEFTTGSSYPDGGNKTGWGVSDLCDKCVVRLRALLKEQDVTTSVVDITW